MRNKKNNINIPWLYIAIALFIIAVIWAVSRDIPFSPEQVEEILEKKLG